MTAWREATVAELCERVDYGYTASASEAPGLPRFLRITDIVGSHIDWRTVPGCEIDEQGLAKFRLEDGDIVVARTGATVGHAKRVRDLPLAVFASYLVRFRPAREIEPSFLGAVMESAAYKEWVRQNAGGAAQPNANAKTLGAFRLRIPDRSTQKRIGAIADAFDELIENNRRRVEVLEEMARAIYREWFVHFRYPGHEDVPLVESPLGLIPEGWEVRPFSELASFVNGFAFKPAHWGDSGRPIIKIKQLKQGVTPDTPRCDPETIASKYWVEPGDLLFSWSADLGVYRWSGEPGLLNQHLFLVKPNERTTVDYLYHALDRAIPQFWDRAQGTTMRHIKRSALSEVTTVVPPRELVSQFSEVVGPIDSEASGLGQESRSLAGLRDLLLPKLVTGQIDVTRLDLDELVEEAVSA